METTEPPSTEPQPIDSRQILEEMLARCHKAAGECLAVDSGCWGIDPTIRAYKVAQALMATGIKLAAALERKPAQSTHRIIVERIGPADTAPITLSENRKTIKSGGTLKDLQDIE